MRVYIVVIKGEAERDGKWPYHMAICNTALHSKKLIDSSHKWHLSRHCLHPPISTHLGSAPWRPQVKLIPPPLSLILCLCNANAPMLPLLQALEPPQVDDAASYVALFLVQDFIILKAFSAISSSTRRL